MSDSSSNADSDNATKGLPAPLLPPSAKEAAGLYLSGMEIPQVAKLLHTSEAVIRDWLKRQGVQLRRRRAPRLVDQPVVAPDTPPTENTAPPPSPDTVASVPPAQPRVPKPGSGRGRPRVEINPAHWAQIESAYRAGQTIAAIADTFGYRYSVVRRSLAEHGVPIRRVGSGAKRTIPEARLEEVRRLRQSGLTTQQIAEEFQIPLRTAYYWLSKTADLDQ